MKVVKVSIMMIALILMIASCKKDKKENVINKPAVEVINLENPNDLNRALQINGATLVEGTIPDIQQVGPANPVLRNSRNIIFTRAGNTFTLKFTFAAGADGFAYAGCLLNVDRAGEHYHIPAQGEGSNIAIPIQLPEKMVGDSFKINYTVYDQGGLFSKQNSVIVNLSTRAVRDIGIEPATPRSNGFSDMAPIELPYK